MYMSGYYLRTIRTVDSHTQGNPTRVIVGGVPIPRGTLDRLPPIAQVSPGSYRRAVP